MKNSTKVSEVLREAALYFNYRYDRNYAMAVERVMRSKGIPTHVVIKVGDDKRSAPLHALAFTHASSVQEGIYIDEETDAVFALESLYSAITDGEYEKEIKKLDYAAQCKYEDAWRDACENFQHFTQQMYLWLLAHVAEDELEAPLSKQ